MDWRNPDREGFRWKDLGRRPKDWIDSERLWEYRLGREDDKWDGVKVLGKGGFGVVGHWRRRHPREGEVNDICVKQALSDRYKGPKGRQPGLKEELRLLRLANEGGSRHFVGVYSERVRESVGLGYNHVDFGEIHRIYLEFCSNGDLETWAISKWHAVRGKHGEGLLEEELWTIFHCLAKAVAVLQCGQEDGKIPPRRKEILHFDLKPPNILLSEEINDNEHKNMPIFKMADFGISAEVPRPDDQSDEWYESLRTRGTSMTLIPEQLYYIVEDIPRDPRHQRPWNRKGTDYAHRVKSKKYGSWSNIWQVGLIMWCLLRAQKYPYWDAPKNTKPLMKMYKSKLNKHIMTVGIDTDIEQDAGSRPSRYSEPLRALIAQCMAVQSADRPSVRRLLATTGIGLQECWKARRALNSVPPRGHQAPGSGRPDSPQEEGRREKQGRRGPPPRPRALGPPPFTIKVAFEVQDGGFKTVIYSFPRIEWGWSVKELKRRMMDVKPEFKWEQITLLDGRGREVDDDDGLISLRLEPLGDNIYGILTAVWTG